MRGNMKWYWVLLLVLLPLIITFTYNYYSEKKCVKKCLLDPKCIDDCQDKFAKKL